MHHNKTTVRVQCYTVHNKFIYKFPRDHRLKINNSKQFIYNGIRRTSCMFVCLSTSWRTANSYLTAIMEATDIDFLLNPSY